MTQRKTGVQSPIAAVLGAVPVMPGESEQQFQASLAELVQELQATTVLQRYLAEKIHECLWWMRRYQAQKRATIVAEMAALTNGGRKFDVTPTEEHIRNLLLNNQTDKTLRLVLAEIRHTPESLQQKAMANKAIALQQLDQQLALQAKILAGLQASYEVAFNRKAHAERLQLQNSLLRRDLQAIDLDRLISEQPAPASHGKP